MKNLDIHWSASVLNFENSNKQIYNSKNIDILNIIDEVIKNLPALKIVNNALLLDQTIDQANNFAKNKDQFIVFGTGGSNLGSRALINIIQNKKNNKIFFYDNIDPINFETFLKQFNLEKIGFIIISKSGATPETLSQFACLIEIFEQKNNLNIFFKNCLILTENKPSPLKKIGIANKCLIVNHEENIGGRYSIFSNVGMLPAIIAGLDVKKIHFGAKSQLERNKENSKYIFDQFKNLGQYFLQNKVLIKNKVLMTYSDALFYFGKWYLQLWSESIGKDYKGITAIHAVGTTDQHSQLQLYLNGPKDKFFTFVTTNHIKKGLKIHEKSMQENDLHFLAGKTMGDLMQAEQQSTIDVFKKYSLPFRVINLPSINEFAMGQLMCFSIMETIAACIYFDVNPFDQPAVELSKNLTKKYLSK